MEARARAPGWRRRREAPPSDRSSPDERLAANAEKYTHEAVREGTKWPYWQGSATEIQRLAKRAEARLHRYFTPFQNLPRDAWYVLPGVLRQQEALDFTYAVITRDWENDYPAASDGLPDEIKAPVTHARISEITLKASATTIVAGSRSRSPNTRSRKSLTESPLAVVEPALIDPTPHGDRTAAADRAELPSENFPPHSCFGLGPATV